MARPSGTHPRQASRVLRRCRSPIASVARLSVSVWQDQQRCNSRGIGPATVQQSAGGCRHMKPFAGGGRPRPKQGLDQGPAGVRPHAQRHGSTWPHFYPGCGPVASATTAFSELSVPGDRGSASVSSRELPHDSEVQAPTRRTVVPRPPVHCSDCVRSPRSSTTCATITPSSCSRFSEAPCGRRPNPTTWTWRRPVRIHGVTPLHHPHDPGVAVVVLHGLAICAIWSCLDGSAITGGAGVHRAAVTRPPIATRMDRMCPPSRPRT